MCNSNIHIYVYCVKTLTEKGERAGKKLFNAVQTEWVFLEHWSQRSGVLFCPQQGMQIENQITKDSRVERT